jgi:preprotein translocase subunit YajC
MNALFFLTDGAAGGGIGSFVTMGLLLVVMIAMFFFTSRSNKKQEKEAQTMRDSLSVGDEITTIGGIIGKVVSIKEETLVLETSHDRTRIRILKTAVSRVDVKAEDAQD